MENSNLALEEKYEQEFIPGIHFLGRLFILTVVLVSLLPPLYLSFVQGYHPGWGPIFAGFGQAALLFGMFWIIEPMSYFPILGVPGTYLSFLSGNTANMRIPAIAAAQNVLGLKTGTKKAELAGIISLSASIITNILILGILIVIGTSFLELLPESVMGAFKYVMPAIFGSMFITFAMRTDKRYLIRLIPVGILIALLPIPAGTEPVVAFIIGITYSIVQNKMDLKKEIKQ